MAWIRIKDIHECDAYSYNREALIGKRFSDKNLVTSVIGEPWKEGDVGYGYYFLAVKVEKA